MKPTVSVVMTCYNYEKYVARSIESVLKQTHKDLELMIINDGSTDNSDSVIRSYIKDKRVRYIIQDNAGQARAKNIGIKYSCGKYIAFLDADDLWENEKLELQLPLLKKKNVGLVYSNATWIDEGDSVLGQGWLGGYLKPRSGKVTEYLIYDNFIYFSSAVIKRDCVDGTGYFNESLSMGIDWELWLRLSSKCKFDFVDKHLIQYRWGHAGQMSRNQNIRLECTMNILEDYLRYNSKHISFAAIRGALAYAYYNRGCYFQHCDYNVSKIYFIKSIKMNPLKIKAWIGLLNNLLLSSVRMRIF